MGLVDRVVPEAALDDYVRDYALTIAANAPMTMHAAKISILEALKNPADRDLALCERLVDDCHDSQDYLEGRRAFMEKRKPKFVGR
jgi:enoyl-CoA hydratase/carnithine racemase